MEFGLFSAAMLFAIVGLAGVGLSLVAICCSVLFGKGRLRKYLAGVVLLMTIVGAALFGGQFFLERNGMGWRCWVKGVMAALCVALLWAAILLTQRIMATQPVGRDGLDQAVTLVTGVALLAILFYGGIGVVFGSWTDRVTEYQGQKVVVETTGIFQENWYRYVNPLVRGELVYEWRD